ncbi:unnamed protein product [Thlaspi arvense]|uniref:Fatty acid desaturase domain-containing protein n=1 Tax=Thlaspi arvense TaxID=13288 RepID=A0AAU9S3P1_THLAR|nr:unnamed protein product [Thlaspi arvense]
MKFLNEYFEKKRESFSLSCDMYNSHQLEQTTYTAIPMASLCTFKPLSPASQFVKQRNPRNQNALFTYHTPNSTNSLLPKRGRSVAHKKHMFVTAHDAPDPVESSWRIPLSDVVAVRKKREFWERSWNSKDVRKLVVVVGVHLLTFSAPFYFNWVAFRLFIWLHVTSGMCITLSYHRNLAHRSFDLPKWLEYLFAYGGVLALQGDPIDWVSNHRYHHKHCETERDPHSPTQGFWFSHMTWIFDTGSILKKCGGEENVNDLVRQPFYRFLQRTFLLHVMAFALLLYFCGGMPFLVWGFGVATVVRFHGTFLVNSVCHIWGKRAWNTPDLSKNNWWAAIITLGEGWHNNHHAFEFSARHGLEWWQLDVTWFLESHGLGRDHDDFNTMGVNCKGINCKNLNPWHLYLQLPNRFLLFRHFVNNPTSMKHTFVAVDDAPDQVESSRRIPFTEAVAVREKRAFWERSWTHWDVGKLAIIGGVHLLSLSAPFHFNWTAFRLFLWLYVIHGICITLSYHRNLSHRSFDLPKWLEYLLAYGGVLAIQGDPIEWVSNHRYHHKHCETQRDPHSPTQGFWFSHMTWLFDTGSILKKCGGEENVNDLVKQPFYRFLQRTAVLHMMALALLLYICGGMPFLVWGFGVASVARLQGAFLVNSVCHLWGTRAWNTPDLWAAIITLGEGWHNNHHAFEFSARHGLEWWQLDVTWYLIRFLEAMGLASNVKLPTEAHKKKMACN